MRTLKAEFWTDPDVCALPLRCRFTYAGLICAYVDDFGRELDDLRLIKAAVWPLNDEVTIDDIAEDLATLNMTGKVVRYDDTTSGQRGLRRGPSEQHVRSRQRYLFLANWRKHQRVDKPTPSKYPAPPAKSRMTREQLAIPLESLRPEVELEVEVDKEKEVERARGKNRSRAPKAKSNGSVQAHDPEDPKAKWNEVREKLAASKSMPAD